MKRLDGLPKRSRHAPAALRFENAYLPEPNSGCWIWIKYANASGYGTFRLGGLQILAHHASLTLHGRTISSECVLHTCDTPCCVNPDHLVCGTQQENIADMHRKGRRADFSGMRHARRKLNEDDVRSIRADIRPYKVVAAEYGVTHHLISQIRRNLCWKGVH